MIRNLGPACLYECSKCKERYVGAQGDFATQTWKKAHRESHWTSSRGRPEWQNEER